MSNSWFAMTREEAERAAAKINAFWRARGHDAGARVVKQQVGHDWEGKHTYGVRSDLVNGLPRAPKRRRLTAVPS